MKDDYEEEYHFYVEDGGKMSYAEFRDKMRTADKKLLDLLKKVVE